MMSIGRISMLEFMKPEDVDASEEYYKIYQGRLFPYLRAGVKHPYRPNINHVYSSLSVL